MADSRSLHQSVQRFSGTVEWLAVIDIRRMAEWITAIDLADWDQQHRLADGQLRPAMMTDRNWHGFGEIAEPVVAALMTLFPGCQSDQWMLSAVMPGHRIEPHVDRQPPHWLCRIHVPLATNPDSVFMVGGRAHSLEIGQAYRVNTEAEHAVANDGLTPRIHLMFDVRR